MRATDRMLTEQALHDIQAQSRRDYFADHPNEWQVDDDLYLEHETWVRPAFELLGDVHGQRVLDLGCGHGMASVVLARRGAEVTALELSGWYLGEARDRAAANGVSDAIQFVQASAERLPFRTGSFDAIWGNAILHHLDLKHAASELRRILAPGGRAVFCEPWGGNPFLEWARRWLPYRGKARSPAERPLRQRDLQQLREHFGDVRTQAFQLLGMARRLWPKAGFLSTLERCDARVLAKLPLLERYCRYLVLCLRP